MKAGNLAALEASAAAEIAVAAAVAVVADTAEADEIDKAAAVAVAGAIAAAGTSEADGAAVAAEPGRWTDQRAEPVDAESAGIVEAAEELDCWPGRGCFHMTAMFEPRKSSAATALESDPVAIPSW